MATAAVDVCAGCHEATGEAEGTWCVHGLPGGWCGWDRGDFGGALWTELRVADLVLSVRRSSEGSGRVITQNLHYGLHVSKRSLWTRDHSPSPLVIGWRIPGGEKVLVKLKGEADSPHGSVLQQQQRKNCVSFSDM